MKRALVLISLVILAGCIPPFPKYETITPAPIYSKIAKIDMSTYNIGMVQEKTVGETMLTVATGSEQTSDLYKATVAYLPPDYTVMHTTAKTPSILEGSTWKLLGTTPVGDKIYSSDSYPANYCLVSNAQDEFYGVTGCTLFYAGIWPEKKSGLLRPEMVITYADGAFKQEFLYNGKSKDTIKLQYREYKDTFARPAFFQELSYDLAESKGIGFRGMIIEVLEATNSKIRFVVKSKMN